jgi:peptidyl-prolyl cis-trans isomerase D
MLDTLRRQQRWLMGGVVALVGGVFILYLGIGGPLRRAASLGRMGGSGYLVELDGRRYGLGDLERVREDQERQLKATLGDSFNPAAAGPYLDQMAADQIIQRAVLASEAERLGLRASDDEVRQLVRSAFRAPQGTFDAQAVREYAARRFGSEGRFVDEVKDDILAQKLLELVDATADVSDAEVRDAIRYHREQVRLAIVALDSEKLPDGIEVSDEEIEKLLGQQADRVRRFYDEHAERYHVPERVRARHILLRIEKDAPDDKVAEVKKRAEQALKRVRTGEDFAAVAKELSEDPGSKPRGGDLGFFPRGQMAGPFEEVAFTLEPGKISDLVRTDFGFHVIRVEAHEAAKDQSFDEEARPIAEELARADRAGELAEQRSDQLAAAVRGGQSLVDAARAAGVAIERPDWFGRQPDGQVPGLGAAPEVMTLAFALTPEKPSSERVFEVGPKRVLIELLERRGPTPEEMAKDLAPAREGLLEARRSGARSRWLQAARDRLVAERRLAIDLTPLQEQQKQRAKEAS